MNPQMTTPAPEVLARLDRSGQDLRHTMTALDGTVIPAWSTIAPTAWPCTSATATIVVLRDSRGYSPAALVRGTSLEVATTVLAHAAGDYELPNRRFPAHSTDGRCCHPNHDAVAPLA